MLLPLLSHQAEADADQGSEDEGEEDLLFVEDRLGQDDDDEQQQAGSGDEEGQQAGPGPGSMALQQEQRGAQHVDNSWFD